MFRLRSAFAITCLCLLLFLPLRGRGQGLTTPLPSAMMPFAIPNRGMESGNGKWMEIPDNSSIAIPVFTAEVWVKASSGGLIVTRDISTGTPSDWQLWYEFSRKRLAFITAKSPPDTYYYTPDNSFLPNTWYHVALVVNGPAGTARLYINGNLIISPTFTPRFFDCTTGLAWCGYYDNTSGAYLDGEIDEARYWNIERTQLQINATKDIDIPRNDRLGLVGWWRFCDSFEDYSGAGNHGTPRGGPQLVLNTLPFGITCDIHPCDSVEVFISGIQSICENDSTILTASPGFKAYLWSTGDTTQSIIVRTTGRYSVVAVDDSGCVAQAVIDVTVFPLPPADAGPDIDICAAVSGTIGTMTQTPGWTYRWSPPDGLSHPDSAITRVTTGVTRTYILSVTDDHGCVASDTVQVIVRSGLDLALPDSVHICPGTSVTLPLAVLSGTAPYTFLWSPSGSLSEQDVQNPVASPATTQWYHVHVTDSKGCFSEDSILVVLTQGLETELPDSLVLCDGASIALPLQVRRGTPPYRYEWTPPGTLSAADVQNPVATADTTRWYYVSVWDSLGCTGKDSVLVVVGGDLLTSMPDSLIICPNTAVTLPLDVTGGSGTLQFDWTPEADLSDPHVQKPVARPKQTTTYYVHVRDAFGCEAHDSITVGFYPKSDLDIVIMGAATFCEGDSVILRATPGYRSYRWHTPSRIIPDTGNTIIAREAGRYSVVVTDSNGCETTSLPVTISTYPAFVIPVTVHGTQPLCPGDSLELEAASGYDDYVWTDDSGRVIGTGQRIAIGRPGRYHVAARDSSGCIGSSPPVIITAAAQPVFDIAGPRIVCLGGMHEYSTLYRARWSYQWSVTGGDIQPPADKQAVRIHWIAPGRMTMRLVVRDNQTGCSDTMTFTVDVITALRPKILADGPTVFCEGDSVLLRSRESHDLSEWRDSSGRILGSGSSLIARSGGMYYYHASTVDSCSGVDSILVTVIPAPRPKILGPIDICLGDTVTCRLSSGGGEIRWNVFGGTVLASDSTSVTVFRGTPGMITIVVTEISPGTDPPCVGSDTLRVIVHPLPDPGLTLFPDSVICADDWVTLTAAAGLARYIWTTPSGTVDTSAHQLTVNEPGIYSVTVISAVGCSASSRPLNITVLPVPEVLIEGPVSICRDGIGSYSVRGLTGVTYRWSATGGTMVSDSTADSVDVRWTSAGTGMITVLVDNGFCPVADTLFVQVGDTLKPVITADGPLLFCPGGEVMLDAGAGYATYAWTTPDGPQSGQRIPASRPGRYIVHVTAVSGCEGTSDPVEVEILPAPKPLIFGPDGLCPGDTVVLEASPGYVSYRWDDGTTGRFCSVTAAGARTVTVTDSNGCTGTSDTHVLIVYALPVPPVITRQGARLVSTPATSYQWFRNDTLLAGEIGCECPILFPGRYAVAVTNAQGCPAMSDALLTGCVTGTSVVALPHLVAAPGDTVDIALAVQQSTCLDELGATNFATAIRFNKTLLVPIETTPVGIIEGHDRIVDITSSLDALRKQSLPLRFLVTLGDRDSIPLVLEQFAWLDAPVAVTRFDGSLRLIICREGGDRLFDSEGQARLLQNRPNPFNAMTVIEFETIEAGPTEVYVLNILGRRVRTLHHGHLDPGRYSVFFDASDLPSGQYICVLRTSRLALQRAMSLIK
jgi:hypothetical protein